MTTVANQKIEASNRQIRNAANIGLICNVLLCAAKLLFGLLGCSIALIADGFHSLSDIATDFAVLIGTRFGSKAPDTKHPYGHGRAETFATAIIAAVLAIVGAAIPNKTTAKVNDIAKMGTLNKRPLRFIVYSPFCQVALSQQNTVACLKFNLFRQSIHFAKEPLLITPFENNHLIN